MSQKTFKYKKGKNIDNLVTNYIEDDLSGLVITDKLYHGSSYKKINVYNKLIKTPLQKIWIRMPKVKIFKSTIGLFLDQKSIPLSVYLAPNIGKVRKFRVFIKKLERKIKKLLGFKNLGKSAIKKLDNFPDIFTVKMKSEKVNNCHEFKFHVYNNFNKRVNLTTLKSGTYISAYIELSEVWINGDDFGFNWSVLQMKVYPEFDFTKCLFLDETDCESEDEQPDECYHCMYCPNKHVRTHFCPSSHPHISNASNAQNSFNFNNFNNSNIPPPPPMNIPINNPINITKPLPKIPTDKTNSPQNNKNDNEQRSFFVPPSVQDLLSVKLKPVKKNNDKYNNDKNNDNKNNDSENDKDKIIKDVKSKLKSVENSFESTDSN